MNVRIAVAGLCIMLASCSGRVAADYPFVAPSAEELRKAFKTAGLSDVASDLGLSSRFAYKEFVSPEVLDLCFLSAALEFCTNDHKRESRPVYRHPETVVPYVSLFASKFESPEECLRRIEKVREVLFNAVQGANQES